MALGSCKALSVLPVAKPRYANSSKNVSDMMPYGTVLARCVRRCIYYRACEGLSPACQHLRCAVDYLALLDDYVSAQAMIKKQMASGFMSLAQANFKSPTRRYGQDYYDDRAVASARVKVTETEHGTQMAIVGHTFGNVVDEKSTGSC